MRISIRQRRAFLSRLEDLLITREKHVDVRRSLQQVANEVGDETAKLFATATIEVLDGTIKALEREIKALIESDPDHAEAYQVLTSVPGIGTITAAALCCWMPELGAMDRRQAAALIGVAPFARDSGVSEGARHIRGGRRRPRDILYMAALTARRHNPDMKTIYERLTDAGKDHKVALVAVMRHLIVLANALLRDTGAVGRRRRHWPRDGRAGPHNPAAIAPSRRRDTGRDSGGNESRRGQFCEFLGKNPPELEKTVALRHGCSCRI